MRTGYAWTRTPKVDRALRERRALVLPEWKLAYEMRQSGMKFWQIGERMGRSASSVFNVVTKYHEHLLGGAK